MRTIHDTDQARISYWTLRWASVLVLSVEYLRSQEVYRLALPSKKLSSSHLATTGYLQRHSLSKSSWPDGAQHREVRSDLHVHHPHSSPLLPCSRRSCLRSADRSHVRGWSAVAMPTAEINKLAPSPANCLVFTAWLVSYHHDCGVETDV